MELNQDTRLYLIPTPIGNLGDMTFRAVEVLKAVDFVLCEDTRTSGNLLKYFEVQKSLVSFHMHNEHQVLPKILERLRAGQTAAQISDAGSPGISDPGFLLARACIQEGIRTETLPGATAFVPALVQSGIPCNHFVFEGFLPVKKGRQTRLKILAEEERTFILYESPHRIVKCLKELAECCGADRQASVSRELTKLHEETVRGTLSELIQHFENQAPKGEFVIVVAGKG